MLGQAGLDLPTLTPRARDGINGILKDFGWAANPADVTGFARREEFRDIMNYLIEEPEVGTLVIASAGAGNQVDQVIELRDRTDKNVAFMWTATRADKNTLPKLKSANIPIFYSPASLARGLRSVRDYHDVRERRLARTRSGMASEADRQRALSKLAAHSGAPGVLSEKISKAIVADWGIPVVSDVTAATAEAAVAAAERLGYPVVLKVDSPDIPHKTEAGGVRVGLRNADEVRAAFGGITASAAKHVPGAAIHGVLVQPMIGDAIEVIIGVKHDPQIGPMLLFGTGGVMVEVYDDVALRRCPIARNEALDMIDEVKGAKLLRGFRGKPAGDIDALADALVRISEVAATLGSKLAELDINPLMVLPQRAGVKAVDALIRLNG
jgi:acetyltransferase